MAGRTERKRKQASGAAKRAAARAKVVPAAVKVAEAAPAGVLPLRFGVVRWRSLVRDAAGVNEIPAEHSALPRMNMAWKGLLVHWLDGCPCDSCVAAAAGLVVRKRRAA